MTRSLDWLMLLWWHFSEQNYLYKMSFMFAVRPRIRGHPDCGILIGMSFYSFFFFFSDLGSEAVQRSLRIKNINWKSCCGDNSVVFSPPDGSSVTLNRSGWRFGVLCVCVRACVWTELKSSCSKQLMCHSDFQTSLEFFFLKCTGFHLQRQDPPHPHPPPWRVAAFSKP